LLLTFRRLFLGMFLCHVTAHQAATHCADYRVMPGIMPRDSAHNRAFHATGGVGRADHGRRECYRCEGGFDVTSFHLKSTVLLEGAKVMPFDAFSIAFTAIALPGFMFLSLPPAGNRLSNGHLH
jgi:hypothetical protein